MAAKESEMIKVRKLVTEKGLTPTPPRKGWLDPALPSIWRLGTKQVEEGKRNDSRRPCSLDAGRHYRCPAFPD